jgi:dTDP-4-dehydrorhamnose 3,5-epimerase
VEGVELMGDAAPRLAATGGFACRGCGAIVVRCVLDLGKQPLANSYLDKSALNRPEPVFPLRLFVCERCFLVQLEGLVGPDALFSDYSYFSSYSSTWLDHARRFASMATARFGLSGRSQVVEIASNDGYLLKNFVEFGIPALGVEPAANVAAVAREKGVPTDVRFFGRQTAHDLVRRGHSADLVIANNVVAHVPEVRDFLAGVAVLLKPEGVFSVEFPHLLRMLEEGEFDTIYHEHFSYLSLRALEAVLAGSGLRVFDVEKLATHGGSLRVLACLSEAHYPESADVSALREEEEEAGLGRLATYDAFAECVSKCSAALVGFVRSARADGRVIAAYGAAAKGNTLLNACELSSKDIVCVADRSPHKQGRFLPGSHIPIVAPIRNPAGLSPYPPLEPARRDHRCHVACAQLGVPVRCRGPERCDRGMRFAETLIPGVTVIELEPNVDARGSFARFFCAEEFAAASLPGRFVQGSVSRNVRRGTLRGMHLQLGTQPEEKVVRCTRGRVHDIVLDLRRESSTYLRWIAVELDAESGRAIFIPGGCAHGFLTLEHDSELLYLMTVAFDPRHQHGFRWNDPAFAISWPFEPRVMSQRDREFPDYPAQPAGRSLGIKGGLP